MTFGDCLLVAAGGAVGCVARFLVTGWVSGRTPTGFPYGTFAVNIAGCFLLGLLMTGLSRRPEVWAGWRLFLGVGFLGGFTTFSTLLWETSRLTPRLALLNLLLSCLAGWLATLLGQAMGKQ